MGVGVIVGTIAAVTLIIAAKKNPGSKLHISQIELFFNKAYYFLNFFSLFNPPEADKGLIPRLLRR